MLSLSFKRLFVSATILSLLFAISLPTVALADQGRRHGRDRRFERRDDRSDRFRRDDRKSRRFRNGHDARDGRWDGRGPRRNRVNDRYNDDNVRYRSRSSYRNRWRNNTRTRNYRTSDYRRYDDSYYRTNDNGGGVSVLGGILGSILGGQ